MKAITIAAITTLALAGSLAFAAGPGEGEGRGGRHGREDRGDRLARLTEELQLSDQQVAAIKQLHEEQRATRRENRQQAQSLATQWAELKEKGDAKGAEKLRSQLSTMKEESHIRRLAGAARFESILTEEQRQKFEQMREERTRHGRGRGGDGPDGPGAPPEN